MAIIAILAAMLMPALSKARESAMRGSCLANLKQQYLGLAQYSSDYLDWLPLAPCGTYGRQQFYRTYGGKLLQFSAMMERYLGFAWEDPDSSYVTNSKHIFACPSSKISQLGFANSPKHHRTFSGYLIGLGSNSNGTDPAQRNMRLLRAGVSGPLGKKVLVFDLVAFQKGSLSEPTAYSQAVHNREGGNVLFGDGSGKWESASAFPTSTHWSTEGVNPPSLNYYVYVTEANYIKPGNVWQDRPGNLFR